ncbi:hypothetical protein [Streptomyces fradiae]|uniref:hypothetical protein n=1 Tax=Streptomyces fradiae TaxID=1906 RepID=UPI0035181CB2
MTDGVGFSLVWGVGATAFGWIVATDFRGAAYRLHAWADRLPFGGWRGATPGIRYLRFVAAVLAVVGPLTILAGVRDLTAGRGPVRDFGAVPLPFVAVWAVIGAVALWRVWRADGPLRRQWGGGWPRRVAAAVMSAALPGFLAGAALGHMVTLLVSWLVGGAAGLLLLVLRDPREERAAP